MHAEYGGHGREIATTMELSDWDGIVICSGDGLVYEVWTVPCLQIYRHT